MVKNRKTRCGGLSRIPHAWGKGAEDLFYSLVDDVRAEFRQDMQDPSRFEGEVLYGDRTINDQVVLWTLKSAATEEQFRSEPLTWIYDALQDCAERDFWYKFEKEYD